MRNFAHLRRFVFSSGIGPNTVIYLLGSAAFGIFGFKLITQPKVQNGLQRFPEGFTPTHQHKNIALDANTGRLWVRDDSGRSKVLDRSEVIGWEWSSLEGTNNISGSHFNKENRLLIKVQDLDHPVYKVSFDAHGTVWISGLNANHKECKEWFERLNAAYGSR